MGALALGKKAYAMSAEEAIAKVSARTGASEEQIWQLIQKGSNLLTADEVESDRARLEDLLFRTKVKTPNADIPWMFGYAIASRDGMILRGVARTQQWTRDRPALQGVTGA